MTAMKKLVPLTLLTLTGLYWAVRSLAQRGQLKSSKKSQAPAVQTWEGEGGALPTTGSQMGPDPAVTPSQSKPKSKSKKAKVHHQPSRSSH